MQEHITSLVLNENNGLADVVKPEEVHMEHVRGPGTIYEELHFELDDTQEDQKEDTKVMRFRISPFSFFQTNTLGAQQLFSKAAELVGHVEGNVIDLYCGSGTI